MMQTGRKKETMTDKEQRKQPCGVCGHPIGTDAMVVDEITQEVFHARCVSEEPEK